MNFDLECHVFNIPDQNLSHCGLVIRPRDIRRHHEVLRQEGMDHKIHGTASAAGRDVEVAAEDVAEAQSLRARASGRSPRLNAASFRKAPLNQNSIALSKTVKTA